MFMKNIIWLKPACMGAAAGAIALAVVGFGWGGWMTESKANQVAATKSRLAVVSALVPICLEQARQDPQETETLAMLKRANAYERGGMLMKAGWATMPGTDDPNRLVAQACASELSLKF
jgi:hypothetical protein